MKVLRSKNVANVGDVSNVGSLVDKLFRNFEKLSEDISKLKAIDMNTTVQQQLQHELQKVRFVSVPLSICTSKPVNTGLLFYSFGFGSFLYL